MGTFSNHDRPRLAIIGGGLAGIAAAEHAVRQGWSVELFEWSRVLGGRAASQLEPKSRRWIDNGQHIFLGCCTELLGLHERLGLTDLFEQFDSITFSATENRRWNFGASPFLPPHWQFVPSFFKNPFLTFKDRLLTGLLLRKLAKLSRGINRDSVGDNFHKIDVNKANKAGGLNGSQLSTSQRNALGINNAGFNGLDNGQGNKETFGHWLRREGASEESINRFWTPLIHSALSDTVEGVCLFAAEKIVKQMLVGRDAMSMYVPKCPLRDIYHYETLRKLEHLGVHTHFLSRVERLDWSEDEPDRIKALILAGSGPQERRRREFDSFVIAVPAFRIWKLLEESRLEPLSDSLGLERYELGAITSVHLWLDRPILPDAQKHSAILDGLGQWIFYGDRSYLQLDETQSIEGHYYQVVISASHRLLSDVELTCKGREKLTQRVWEQLLQIFPECRNAQLLHSKTTTVCDAVFSPNPEIYRFRPPQATSFVNLALAGDWTSTNWPATMEGAVRSGIAAVNVLNPELAHCEPVEIG